VEKMSVSMPAEVAELVRSQAADAGVPVSAWVTAARAGEGDRRGRRSRGCRSRGRVAGRGRGPARAGDRRRPCLVAEVLASAGITARVAG